MTTTAKETNEDNSKDTMKKDKGTINATTTNLSEEIESTEDD
jgi:hypothetical protein